MERVKAAVRDGLVAERWIEVRNTRSQRISLKVQTRLQIATGLMQIRTCLSLLGDNEVGGK